MAPRTRKQRQVSHLKKMNHLRTAAPDSDSELLLLGKQLEECMPELKAVRGWVDELLGLYEVEVEKRATWPEDQSEWTKWDARAYLETRRRVETETEIGKAFARASNAEQSFYDNRIYPLCDRIKAFGPQTAEGRLVKCWARAVQIGKTHFFLNQSWNAKDDQPTHGGTEAESGAS